MKVKLFSSHRRALILHPGAFILASRRLLVLAGFSVLLILQAQAWSTPCLAQSVERQSAEVVGKVQDKAVHKVNPESLRKYAGRYELETGIIPISTLDVTLEGSDLWVKPSLIKKRRLARKSKSQFIDEIEGKPYVFNKDEEGKIVSLTFEFEGSSYTAQRVVLPPPSLKGNTTFRLKGYADASIVALAGSFNDWNQSQLIFAREGDEWVCRVDLQPGKYTYKLIVDGNWMLDPANPDAEEDDYGEKNSVLVVGGNK